MKSKPKPATPKRERPPAYQGAAFLRDMTRAVDEAQRKAKREERAA